MNILTKSEKLKLLKMMTYLLKLTSISLGLEKNDPSLIEIENFVDALADDILSETPVEPTA